MKLEKEKGLNLVFYLSFQREWEGIAGAMGINQILWHPSLIVADCISKKSSTDFTRKKLVSFEDK